VERKPEMAAAMTSQMSGLAYSTAHDVIALFTACYHGNAIVAPLDAWRADRCLATRNNIRNTLVAYVYSVTGGGGCYLATRHTIMHGHRCKASSMWSFKIFVCIPADGMACFVLVLVSRNRDCLYRLCPSE
jgi:hypothetical protein